MIYYVMSQIVASTVSNQKIVLPRRDGSVIWLNLSRNYAAIISMAAKTPDRVLQEDPVLLLWHDQAVTRTGET